MVEDQNLESLKSVGDVASSSSPTLATNPTENLSIVERVEQATKKLEDTEKRLEQKKQEYENLIARSLLSGRSSAGHVQKSQEDLNKETIDAEVEKRLNRFK